MCGLSVWKSTAVKGRLRDDSSVAKPPPKRKRTYKKTIVLIRESS